MPTTTYLVHTTLEICANGWQKPVVHLSVTSEIWNFQFKKFADLLITFPFQKTPTCIIHASIKYRHVGRQGAQTSHGYN